MEGERRPPGAYRPVGAGPGPIARVGGRDRMTMRPRRWSVVFVAALGLVAASCGGDGGGVGATLDDYSITLEESSAPAGEVTFDVTNEAEQVHEFVVLSTDLAADQLPTDENGDVDEEGDPSISVVDEIEDVEGGSEQSLTVNLDAGDYVLLCNLPGHYRQGMYTSFTAS